MQEYDNVPSPCYVLDESLLRKNLEQMQFVQEKAGVDIILAFKGFAMWKAFPVVMQYLKGATGSSLYESRLCFEEMGVLAHTYAPVYRPEEFAEIMSYSSHITFNTISQYERYKDQIKNHPTHISCAIRVNPEYSEVHTEMYNPCAPGSRLGEVSDAFVNGLPEGIEGLHFHALCESDSYTLEKTLAAFEQRFGRLLPKVKWVNMGGGHLMTRKGYDIEHLIGLLSRFREKYQVDVILEPGSAVAWETGVLVSTVMDIVENHGIKTIMSDVSFTAHMPDTLEMPYRPRIRGASDPVPGKPTYRIGGTSCLSGDFMYEYSFEKEVNIGDRLIFEDMIHYTMVKTSMFNGVTHPSIAILRENGILDVVRRFTYEDYKNKLS